MRKAIMQMSPHYSTNPKSASENPRCVKFGVHQGIVNKTVSQGQRQITTAAGADQAIFLLWKSMGKKPLIQPFRWQIIQGYQTWYLHV